MKKHKIRVLSLYKSYFPDKGGIAEIIRNIIKATSGHCSHTVLATKVGFVGDTYEMDGASVVREGSIMSISSMPISPMYILRCLMMFHRFDIIHYHYPFPMVDFIISLFFPRRCKLVIHWHSDIVKQKFLIKFCLPFIKRALQRADKIVVTSPIIIENSQLLGQYANKCEVITFGFDIKYWNNISKDDEVAISQIQHCSKEKFILSVGRLVTYKGFKYLIEAMANTTDINLIIIGDGKLKKALNKKISQLGLKERVRILDAVSLTQLRYFYHACEFFILPSISANEAFGIVQVEAMACNKAIINTYIDSAVPWVARNMKEAITVEKKNADALTKAINILQHDIKLRRKLGSAAAKRAKSLFSFENFKKKSAELYQEILK